MGNVIGSSGPSPEKACISMSNQGTDCFLELLEKAAAGSDMTESQRKLFAFLRERREVNLAAPGTASFDVEEMPWNKDTLSEDISHMLRMIAKAKTAEVLSALDYRPDIRIVFPWLDRFGEMIWKLDKDYICGDEERELV